MSKGLDADTLFLACTRPAMFLGVPHEGFLLNFVLSFLAGIWLGTPLYWLIFVPIHFVMRFAASLDHSFFRVWRLWLETKGSSVGSDKWGGSTLAPFPSAPPRTAKEVATSV